MRKLTEPQAQRLAKLYEAGEVQILEEITKALLKGNDIMGLQTMLRNVRKIRADLLRGGRIWSEQVIPALYSQAIDAVDGSLRGELLSGFGAIHQQAMQVLAENTYSRLVDVDTIIGRRVDDLYRDLALESIRGDVIGTATWKQAAKLYKKNLEERGITGFVDALGREWNMSNYTEMVARTTTREAMIAGTANRLLEYGQDLAEIVGGSGRNSCAACQDWVGTVVSLTGATPGYPTLDDARASGVFHANCTHNIATASNF